MSPVRSPVLSPYLSLAMCVAPLELGDICRRDAVTSRVMEGVVCPLCDEHAREFDDETDESALTGHAPSARALRVASVIPSASVGELLGRVHPAGARWPS